VTISSVTLARTIWLPDDGLRTETCRSVFNVLMCKFYTFYICAVVGIIIEYMIVLTDKASAACMELKRIYCKRDVNYIILLQQQKSH